MNKYLFLFLIFCLACAEKEDSKKPGRFNRLSPGRTGIDFKNELIIKKDFDVFRYRNYYNGGGVAIGDINNDGLPDIYLTANMSSNRLYLNKGDFKFEDITETAKVGGEKGWATGVSMADINGDGLLDIYVCNSGDIKGGQRENELFINNGNLTFTETAKAYGLDDKGFGTHAVFFDYDQDGDLDCYVLNNSFRPVSSLGYENIRHERDSTGGDKLYRNDLITPDSSSNFAQSGTPKFTDVSKEAGIFGSVLGFGLGVTITDVNQDNWLDIYVSNDFFERDYLYINQKDGTFKEELPARMGHTSHFSMGTDAADINNDGFPEIFVTDMLPQDDYRLKTMTKFDSYELNKIKLEQGYYEQYMRNTLQLNRGDGSFLEIGQYAGVDATDWSWGALIADLDNNGNKEILVTNGVYKDVTDQDFIDFLANEENLLAAMRQQTVDFSKLVDKMPSTKISNYLFKRTKDLHFENVAADWGLDEPSFSNGAAYGDLDNDGDLDIIINNVNQELFVYRNESEKYDNNNFLKITLTGPEKNRFAVGARISAYAGNRIFMNENVPTKGFQSSMDYAVNIGLDTIPQLDSLIVHYGYGKVQKLYDVKPNQHLKLAIRDAVAVDTATTNTPAPLFHRNTAQLNPAFKHNEDDFVDFHREGLIYHMLSREGPALAVGDINQDGLDDFFVGGAAESPGVLYLQNHNGTFTSSPQPAFDSDRFHEDTDAVFFDANGDGNLDLYVVSGGYVFSENATHYADRLYLHEGIRDGQPHYERAKHALPPSFEMGSCVEYADFDNDGDLDLFVGTRAVPGQYGFSSPSRLLQNDGKGNFKDVTSRIAPELAKLGMVTDAVWSDYDNDDDLDLVIVGEWMPIVLFKNNGTNLERLNNIPGLEKSEGWWNSIAAHDFDGDGNVDFIAGNWGLNSRFRTSEEKPLSLFINDFDENGIYDHVFAYHQNNKVYPMALKHEIIGQIPPLKKKFIFHKDYAGKTVEEVFAKDKLENAVVNEVHSLASTVIFNNGDGTYTRKPLPEILQFSPINTFVSADFDKDEHAEIFLAGNFSGTKPEEGRYDANHGHILKFSGRDILVEDFKKTGLNIKGDVRKAAIANASDGKRLLIVAKNNDELEIYAY